MRLNAALLLVVLACSSQATVSTEPAHEEDAVWACEPEESSRPEIVDLATFLAYPAAVVEGTLVSAEPDPAKDYKYTNYHLEDVIVHRGTVQPGVQPASMTIQQFGGFSPDGTGTWASVVKTLTCGERYLLFLAGGNWRWTPILSPIIRVVDEVDTEFLADGNYAVEVSSEGFGYVSSAPLYELSEESVPNACGWPKMSRVPVRTDEPVPEGAVGVEDVLAAVDATGVQLSGEFQSEPYNWDKPIQVKRNCGDDIEPYYPGCESHPDDRYVIHETGACLTPCPEGTCEEGMSCVQTSVRPACGSESERSGVCSEQIGVCLHTADVGGSVPLDGHGAVIWSVGSSRGQATDPHFVAKDGAFDVEFLGAPLYAVGYDTPYGDLAVGEFVVIEPSIYDLHALEVGEMAAEDVAAMEAAIASNPDAYASSCGYSIVFRDGAREPLRADRDAEIFAYLKDFPLGYACARNLSPIDGKPVLEHIDCSELKLTQGLCNEN